MDHGRTRRLPSGGGRLLTGYHFSTRNLIAACLQALPEEAGLDFIDKGILS